ncbi:hypothetical protein KI688_012724 [Linnemannia hyalina]|uniref:Protein-S-isoprenylcysteine O-methyltransferase n=1 Tax=Linnemannia hyalina TaxID=64524 RepID=A0A9P7XTG2_9FUNG|nr:hypothetical protein KI688_012724 [Linnemannia hyalina]
MLAKAACLVAALVSNALCFKPPPSSKTVDPKKEQKVVCEIRLLTEYANKFPTVLISIATLETALYLVLMTINSTSGGSGAASRILKGSSSLPLHDQVIFQEMGVLKTWQKVTTVLFQSGPYTYLRHPSYTGAILNGICFRFLLFHQGIWNVFTLLASRAASAVLQTKVAVPTSVLGLQTEYWMMLLYGLMMVGGTAYRVRNEEAMLKSHFGREWDVYASKRWRFIPFVY